MNKCQLINKIRSKDVMNQVVKGTWEFSHKGKVFALITNSSSKNVYFLHRPSKPLKRVDGCFMKAVAFILPDYDFILKKESLRGVHATVELDNSAYSSNSTSINLKLLKGDKAVRTTLSHSWKRACKKAKISISKVLTVKSVLVYGLQVMLSFEDLQGEFSQDDFKKVD